MGEKRPETMKRINTPELANAFIEEQVAAIKAQVGFICSSSSSYQSDRQTAGMCTCKSWFTEER